MCMHWHDTLVCRMYWVQTQISVKNNKQTKNLLCVQMQVEDMATLHMCVDRLHTCMQMCYMPTWVSVITKKKKKLTDRKGVWTQHADVLHVHTDVDGGHGHIGGRMQCVCVQMDSVCRPYGHR